MKRFLLPASLAILFWIASAVVGCSKSPDVTPNRPWPPDTLWAVRQADQSYSVYSEWPPDTTIGIAEFNIMGAPPPAVMMMAKSIKHETSTKIAAFHEGTAGPRPWPPDTLRMILRLKKVIR
ncbi:MAG: hypothetical protein NTZ35_08695 [Ignavibacteriales bacterium]|nr:hypothetical protein [Ignavibacteriales bacterium]